MSQNDASSALAAVTATDNADVRKSINIATCDRPDAIGLSRIVDIDTRAGPEFGFHHLKGYDFLRHKEVVLLSTMTQTGQHACCAQGPPGRCLKATFFEIGEDASWHPEITKQVIDAGMTVGTHTTL